MKTAIMFSGQGTQFPGMMRDITEQNPEAKEIFKIAREALGRDIYALTMEGAQEELNQTVNTQPCLLAAELAAWRMLQSLGISYEAALGFSLGEWSALAAAGAITIRDAFRAISLRAEAMQRAVPLGAGGMAAVLGADGQVVSALCRNIGGITPANYNCPRNITVAGTSQAVKRFLLKAQEEGLTVAELAVSIPSHCALMQPAADELAPVIQNLSMRPPKFALVMNATGTMTQDEALIKDNLIRQLTQPVLFQQSVELLLDKGYDTFLELGPGKTLCGMVKRTAKNRGKKVSALPFHSLETAETVRQLIFQ